MSIYDLYIISPYVAMSLAAVLVIVVDLLSPKKALLPAAAILSLLAPLALSLIQLDALGDSPHLLANASSVLTGSLSVDRFALFINLLVIAATGLVVAASTEYAVSYTHLTLPTSDLV